MDGRGCPCGGQRIPARETTNGDEQEDSLGVGTGVGDSDGRRDGAGVVPGGQFGAPDHCDRDEFGAIRRNRVLLLESQAGEPFEAESGV